MSFFQKLKDSATKATEKAQQTVERTRLQSQVSTKQKEIERHYISMGKAVFQAYLADNLQQAEPEIKAGSTAILDLQQEIAELQKRIKELKNEKDCICGQVVPQDVKFCPSCGHKFEDEEKASEQAAVDSSEGVKSTTACMVCNGQIEAGMKFCVHCGASQDGNTGRGEA